MNVNLKFILISGGSVIIGIFGMLWIKLNNYNFSSGETAIWGGIISSLMLLIAILYNTLKQEEAK
jgi:hypothetical protein